MTVISNLRGTSEINFRIGVSGPTIYTGAADPNVTGPTPIDVISIGDVYFHAGGLGNPWFYDGANWNQAVATGAAGTIISGDTTINGNLTVTGQGLFADGSTAAPSIAFAADTNTGFYRRGTDQIGFVTNGAERFYMQDDAIRGTNLRVRAASGAIATPSYTFENDANTGMFNPGPNAIGFSTGSNTALILDSLASATFSNDVTVQGDLIVNGSTTTVNSANLNVTDNIITINDGEAGAGVSLGSAGIEVDRGSLATAGVLWDETFDEWRVGLSSTPSIIARQPDGARASFEIVSTDAIQLPAGTTAQRPSSPVDGMQRYNSTLNTMEAYVNGAWESVPSAPASSTFILNTNNLSDLSDISTAITNLGLDSGGANDIWVDTAGDSMTGSLTMTGTAEIINTLGSAASPSYTFAGDVDTGMFRAGANAIGFAAGGSRVLQMSANNMFVFGASTTAVVNVRREGTIAHGNGVGIIDFEGPNSVGAQQVYARITGAADTITDAGEEGRIDFAVMETGTLTTVGRMQDGRIRGGGSSATNPMFGRITDTNSGLHLPANDTAVLVAGGIESATASEQDFELAPGVDLYIANNAIISSDALGAGVDHTPGTNVDHIWHNDSTNTWNFCSDAGYKTLGNSTLAGEATSALYADLAERYEADAEYPEGTILVIGGDKEVTTTDRPAHHAVAGLVSLYPAFMMNNTEDKDGDPLWPFLALAGRVPCRVIGTVSKGDRVGTSTVFGVATSLEGTTVAPGTVVGIAMEDYDGEEEGLIEVLVRSA